MQVFNEDFIRDAIYYEVERGGQVFYIFNRIQGLKEMTVLIAGTYVPISVSVMRTDKWKVMSWKKGFLNFIDKKYDVLVCTNIVESGVDIPNVNTIIVQNAHQFGLSDLHQLAWARGQKQ